MAFQPQEEQKDLNNTSEYIDAETSQYSQNATQNLSAIFSFSPITLVHDNQSSALFSSNNNPSSYNEDSNGSEESVLCPSDMEDKINQIMHDENFSLEDLSHNELDDDWLIKGLDSIDLKQIDQSIQDRIMSVEIQPPNNIRRRYQSDGKRQIEKSRSKPMTIKLPNLNNCQLNSTQSFWIQLLLITCNKNPKNKVFNHIDKLEYHTNDLPVCDDGYVRVPLTETDLQTGKKQLARVSIIKTKLDAYTFVLTPYNPLPTNVQSDIYENIETKSVVAKAKCFRNAYDLQSSRIACQLLIKQNETWHMTNIVCETNIMTEKEKPDKSRKSSKRSALLDDTDDEYEYTVKKRKRSASLKKRLPVTRVK